jgi:hypothetical protein
MECEFCNKTFSTKSNLYTHQNTAKFCLELQGKQTDEKGFNCEFCNKKYAQKKGLILHVNTCKEKVKKSQNDKQNEHVRLVKQLELEITKLKRIEKDSIKKVTDERDFYYQEKIREKDSYHEILLNEKNEYISKLESNIAKLEAKLEKFENAVVTNMAATTSKLYEDEDEDEEFPIPLGKKLDSIVIEEINEEVEYSNITLNNVVITSRPIDHYVNATQLCQAGGKFFKDWFRLESTKELINELSADGRILPSALVETKRGGNDKSKQGSWIHPDLSIQLAQWISPKFAIQVSKWIRTLFSDGSIEIDLSLMREKEVEMKEKDNRIKQLESVCLSKQRRVVYPERNVIYMLTTEDHLRRRTYIIGKAKNLTNRLSTYNKTCDHTVVHHRECKNEDDMDAVETMVLAKLRSHREQANRDRFILPDDKNESFFTQMIDECVRFLT